MDITAVRKKVGVAPIPLFPLLVFTSFTLLINGRAIFGHQFEQYEFHLVTYLISFGLMYDYLQMRGDRYQIVKWQKGLREITLLGSLPAIAAGVGITAIILGTLYMGLGGGPTKSYGTMWAYLPYAIIAASIEEFIFRFVLVKARLVKFAQPKHEKLFAEVSSAIMFGLFHFGVAIMMFGMSVQAIGMILSAMLMGYLWTLSINLKTELRPGKISIFFGMGFAIGSHITWNVMVTYFGSTLSVLPFIYVMSIPAVLLIPIVILLRRWKK